MRKNRPFNNNRISKKNVKIQISQIFTQHFCIGFPNQNICWFHLMTCGPLLVAFNQITLWITAPAISSLFLIWSYFSFFLATGIHFSQSSDLLQQKQPLWERRSLLAFNPSFNLPGRTLSRFSDQLLFSRWGHAVACSVFAVISSDS